MRGACVLAVTVAMMGSASVSAFVSPTRGGVARSVSSTTPTTRNMMMDWTTASDVITNVQSSVDMASTAAASASSSSNLLLSFTDQGSNLAGIFFQASLLPYLGFLYFLSFRANRIPALGNFGFQFVLLFVISTIPSGILSKSVYGTSLANVDWLHGGAETLLTVANILIVRCVLRDVSRCANKDTSRILVYGVQCAWHTLTSPRVT